MADRTPHLHEILAVEQEKKAGAERARSQSIETFRSKQSHFTGIRRTFTPFAVDEERGEQAGERLEAQTNLVKTVMEELQHTFGVLAHAVDVGFQLDEANTRAKADIVVDDRVLATDVPATFLLQMERRLGEVRALLKEVPTFDPVRRWEPDHSADKAHVLRSEVVTTIRKQRTRQYNVMVEATKEHPAQVDILEVDKPVGEIKSYEWTGMLSPAKKAALLAQLERLLTGVKRARSRANLTPIEPDRKVGEVLLNFLLEPIQE